MGHRHHPSSAAAPQPNKGLVDGMACEPDEHMRKAIVEKAKELGLGLTGENTYRLKYFVWETGDPCLRHTENKMKYTFIPAGEFYDRLCAMPPKPKPIIIDGREVKFLKGGYIKVGCTTVSAADLDIIHEQSLKNR